MTEQLAIFFVSLVANIFSAFSGGGAGLIQFPVLIFLGLSFTTALATHKVATVALGLGATLRHWREHQLQAQFVVMMLGAGLPGVLLGSITIVHVPGQIASFLLGVMTIGLGLYSILNPKLGQAPRELPKTPFRMALGCIGLLLIGILNGSLTSGTGLLSTMWLILWFGMDYKLAVAYTMVFVGLFWNATGAVVLGMLAKIHWVWLPALLVGSLLGGYVGAHLSITKGNRLIKRVYEVVTLLLGLKLLWN